MCLDTVYRGKQKKEALAKLPDSGYYWKCLEIIMGIYCTPVFFERIINGWNKTSGVGYHIFRNKADAQKYRDGFLTTMREKIKLVRCKAKKRNIRQIGMQSGSRLETGLCIVTTRFWCPKPKEQAIEGKE